MPTMAYARERLVDNFAAVLRGLELEPDTYSQLDDNERKLFAQRYQKERKSMMTWSQRIATQNRQEGRQERAALTLLHLLVHRFWPLERANDRAHPQGPRG